MDYLWPCVVFAWLSYLWETYLQWRQRNVYRNVTEVPSELTSLLDQDTFNKSRTYQLDKSTLSLVHNLYKQLEFMLILAVGAIPLCWSAAGWVTSCLGLGEEYESMVFIELLLVYSKMTDLPWSIYSTFVLEDRHGFNKQTPMFFFKDQVKSLVLLLVLIPPIFLGLLYTIQAGGRAFFIYAWLFLAAVTFLFVTVYQEYIAPLFDKFSPLPEGALHSAIRELASSLTFPLRKIQVVEGSKRSAHSNAYLYGFWWNKVIVLFDTLLEPGLLERKDERTKGEEGREGGKERVEHNSEEEEEDEGRQVGEEGLSNAESGDKHVDDDEQKVMKGCTQQEILGVLAHELGHWSLSHTLKLLAISQLNLLISLTVFGYFLEQQDVYTSFSFPNTRPIIIGILLVFQLIFIPYNELMQFVIVQVVRRFEYQADAFARHLGRGGALASALTKLNRDNLSFPVADPLYSAFHHTHPTFLERMRKLPKVE